MSSLPPSGPPPGPPPGSPSSPPGGPPAAPGAAGGGGQKVTISRNQLLVIGGVIVLAIGIVVGVLVVSAGDDDNASGDKADREVLLETVAAVGPAPFTPELTTETPPVTVPQPVSGPAPAGPFGGTGDDTLCDREVLISYLTDPANATQAREWARLVGVSVSGIPAFVRDLVPTVLASDTRVTNHTFENGRVHGYQAVLQAGTAVLVDTKGKLVARCRCGNPLLPPAEVTKPVYTGTKWPGFDPTIVIVVKPNVTVIYPPGGSTTSSTTTTTTRPAGDVDEAIEILRAAFVSCVATVGGDAAELETLSYEGAVTSSGLVSVTVRDTSGEQGVWTVDTATGDITAADPVAAEVGTICAALA